ncbi:MAG: hypothetical protein WCH57_05270 [Verrucomicrobiota bacterium]
MNTQNYEHIALCSPGARSVAGVWRKEFLLLGAVLALFLCSRSEGWATVAPYAVNDSGFSEFALVADLSNGGNFNLNQSTINGNTGVIGASSVNAANNDTLNGSLSYTTSSFDLKNTVTVTGKTFQDATLSSAFLSAENFSQTIYKFTPTQIITGDFKDGTLVGNGGVNVIDFNGNNAKGTITLSGGSKDIFYLNVSSNLNLQGVVLNGVKAENVYWNIINSQGSNLSGSLSGTFFAFSSSGQATSLNINHADISGAVFGGSLNMNNVTIGSIPIEGPSVLVPEASSYAALGAFSAFLAGSSLLRRWRSRQRGESDLPLAAAAV